MMLTATTATMTATAGASAGRKAPARMPDCASLIMAPQSGVGGCTPSPRNESPASSASTYPKFNVDCAPTIGVTFGSTRRNAIHGPLVVAGCMLGVLFGGVEVATVAFAEELGAKAAAGPLLGVFALGSLLSGVATGAMTWRSRNAVRFRTGMLALALALVPLPFVDGFAAMTGVLFLAGFAISPTLIASVALIEETVPASRLTEGIATMTTGMYAGLAPGAAVVGAVVDRQGASASYWVTVVAAMLGALVAFGATLLPSARRITGEGSSPSGSSA